MKLRWDGETRRILESNVLEKLFVNDWLYCGVPIHAGPTRPNSLDLFVVFFIVPAKSVYYFGFRFYFRSIVSLEGFASLWLGFFKTGPRRVGQLIVRQVQRAEFRLSGDKLGPLLHCRLLDEHLWVGCRAIQGQIHELEGCDVRFEQSWGDLCTGLRAKPGLVQSEPFQLRIHLHNPHDEIPETGSQVCRCVLHGAYCYFFQRGRLGSEAIDHDTLELEVWPSWEIPQADHFEALVILFFLFFLFFLLFLFFFFLFFFLFFLLLVVSCSCSLVLLGCGHNQIGTVIFLFFYKSEMSLILGNYMLFKSEMKMSKNWL